MTSKKILIIDDENAIRDMIRFALTSSGFDTAEASTVAEAMKKLTKEIPPALILLDWMLPDMSGIEFIKKLRADQHLKDIPLILLTAKVEEENKVKGLESGADDYVTKPFSPRELIARIHSLLRRGPLMAVDKIIQFNQLKLNVDTRQVTIHESVIELTAIEYKLLHFFLVHQGRAYNRNQLLDYVWGQSHFIEERSVDVVVRRLRGRLKPQGDDKYIQTVRNIGYKFTGKK